MGTINKTTKEINDLLDKVGRMPEGGTQESVEWGKVAGKPAWVDSPTKPAYTAAETGAIPTGGLKTINGQQIEGSGNIEITGGGSGGGISDAPADGEIYGRRNNNWDKIVLPEGGGILDAVELVKLAGQGGVDMPVAMAQELWEAFEGKRTFARIEVGGPPSAIVPIFVSCIDNEIGNLVITVQMPNDEFHVDSLWYIARVDFSANKVNVVGYEMTLPSEKYLLEIMKVPVDISDIIIRLSKMKDGDTVSQSDYGQLKKVSEGRSPIKDIWLSPPYAVLRNPFVGAGKDGIIVLAEFYGYYSPVGYYALLVNKDLKLTMKELNYAGYYTLDGYKKADSYSGLISEDSIQNAIAKLEAGLTPIYLLPVGILELDETSTSEQISTAVGGETGLRAIMKAAEDGCKLRLKKTDSIGASNMDAFHSETGDGEEYLSVSLCFGRFSWPNEYALKGFQISYNKSTRKFIFTKSDCTMTGSGSI